MTDQQIGHTPIVPKVSDVVGGACLAVAEKVGWLVRYGSSEIDEGWEVVERRQARIGKPGV